MGIAIVTSWGLLSKKQLLIDPLLSFCTVIHCLLPSVAKSLVSCEIFSFLSKNKQIGFV